ncbi:hypothetical protein [Clostridium sardiniense]|uniref:hypothetical protein n=1 Tax=Clostridium sardiniense TaxID=29369 RepID=UPI00195679C9|nr:hypothetical protein [Clostridium sardiniense]MBM7833181.1 hypothetical protein [Clostridium sardiniense]
MKKKLLSLVIISIICIGVLQGCGETKSNKKASNNTEQTKSQEIEKEQSQSNKPKVTINDIELVGFKVRKPDSSGDIYMETKFKNNSNQNILSIEYVYEVNGEKSYLFTYGKLKPGDVSDVVKSPGPKSLNVFDAKLLSAQITVENKGEENTYIEYDAKLDTYKQTN